MIKDFSFVLEFTEIFERYNQKNRHINGQTAS